MFFHSWCSHFLQKSKNKTEIVKKQQQESLSAFTVMFGRFWVLSELACVFLPHHLSRSLRAQKNPKSFTTAQLLLTDLMKDPKKSVKQPQLKITRCLLPSLIGSQFLLQFIISDTLTTKIDRITSSVINHNNIEHRVRHQQSHYERQLQSVQQKHVYYQSSYYDWWLS